MNLLNADSFFLAPPEPVDLAEKESEMRNINGDHEQTLLTLLRGFFSGTLCG